VDTHGFWSRFDQSVHPDQGDTERPLQSLRDHLGSMGKNEVTDFRAEHDRCIAEAGSWRLWGAAYLINGGLSGDGFEYLCAWRCSVQPRGRARGQRRCKLQVSIVRVGREVLCRSCDPGAG